MDIFFSFDYVDIFEIVENEKFIRCCFEVSFVIVKIVLVFNRN